MIRLERLELAECIDWTTLDMCPLSKHDFAYRYVKRRFLTKISLNPPRIERGNDFMSIDGRRIRPCMAYISVEGINDFLDSYIDGDNMYLTLEHTQRPPRVWDWHRNDGRLISFLARYSDRLITVILTPLLCSDLRRLVYSFL